MLRRRQPNHALSVCMLVSNDMLSDPRVSRHAQTLGSRGFKVTVICPRSASARQDEIRQGYEIHRSKNLIAEKLIALEAKCRNSSANPLRRQDYNWIKLAPLALIQTLITQLALMRTAKAQLAQIYCANDLDTLPGTILAAGLDRKVVYDSHELWPDMMLVPASIKTMARAVEKLLVRQTDLVMTVNEFIAQELASRYSLQDRPQVVYNCSNTNFHATPSVRNRKVKIVLYQGKYFSDRGLENLVRAADHLQPDIRLVLRGFGTIEQKLRSLAVGRPNVQFEQPVAAGALVSVASEADVGIITYPPTNLNNYLASPNKLFDYIQAGLSIAASNIPFMRKVILENDIGTLFDSRDPRSIAKALNQATREKVLRRQRANVVSVASKYSWKIESKKLLQAYASLE